MVHKLLHFYLIITNKKLYGVYCYTNIIKPFFNYNYLKIWLKQYFAALKDIDCFSSLVQMYKSEWYEI